MLLLRWRNGQIVGLTLGILVFLALAGGARFTQWERERSLTPFSTDFILLISFTALVIVLGATLSWAVWGLLMRAFLPVRFAQPLLQWQRNLSERAVSQLARVD